MLETSVITVSVSSWPTVHLDPRVRGPGEPGGMGTTRGQLELLHWRQRGMDSRQPEGCPWGSDPGVTAAGCAAHAPISQMRKRSSDR